MCEFYISYQPSEQANRSTNQWVDTAACNEIRFIRIA